MTIKLHGIVMIYEWMCINKHLKHCMKHSNKNIKAQITNQLK